MNSRSWRLFCMIKSVSFNRKITDKPSLNGWIFVSVTCGAYRLGKDLVNGTPIRQDFLKKALEWMAANETRDGGRPHGDRKLSDALPGM